ncbi:MAG TPA: HipA family kinase [Bryobacteraceae bacterium]|nr:HipA family kinase [Bryobacteraceae bacterium]
MPLTARRFIRKMRGGAQSHLLEADDGHFYVVKFQNNPQHRRILVNELVASVLLDYLQISAPEGVLIAVGADFLRANPEVGLSLGTRRVPVQAGWHFGSRYPGDPGRTAVYDFLPDALLEQVVNRPEFLGALVFDKWAGNADGRQAVFYRALVRSAHVVAAPPNPGFVARMIDHGYIFNGPYWEFPDSPLQGLYPRRSIYDGVFSLEDFQPWLDRVQHLPPEVLDQAWKRVPPEWIEGEEDAFEQMLETLMARRARVPDLISATRDARPNPFPNWH